MLNVQDNVSCTVLGVECLVYIWTVVPQTYTGTGMFLVFEPATVAEHSYKQSDHIVLHKCLTKTCWMILGTLYGPVISLVFNRIYSSILDVTCHFDTDNICK